MMLMVYLVSGLLYGFFYSALTLTGPRPDTLFCMLVGAMIANVIYLIQILLADLVKKVLTKKSA